MGIVDNHMPVKKWKTVHKPAPFMNQQLRKAIYKKQMLHNKYLHLRSKKNWETYCQQRNFVNKLRRQSIRNYFVECCTGGQPLADVKHTWQHIAIYTLHIQDRQDTKTFK
jgi:hypothetical protein